MPEKEKKQNKEEGIVQKEVLSAGKHSLIYVGGQALSRVVGFFMIPVYTKFIPPQNYGAMELIDTLIASFGLFLSIGIAESMSRFYYSEKSQEMRNIVVSTVIIGLSTISFPIVCFLILISYKLSYFILQESLYQRCLQVAFAATWFGIIFQIGLSFLRMKYMAKTFVLFTTIQLVIELTLNIWFIVFLKLDVLGIFISTLVSQCILSVIITYFILRNIGITISLNKLWDLIKFGIHLVPARFGLMVGFVSNRYFLRWFSSSDPAFALAQVGIYSLGDKFAVIINRFITVPFNAFWGPRRMELLLTESPSSKEIISKMCTYSTFLTVYLALGVSSGIESLIKIMADPKYKGSHIVVPFIAIAYVILSLETHFMSGILYRKKTKYTTYISVIAIVVVILWNIIFIPIFGLIGAATSNLSGFSVRVTLIYIISQKYCPIPFEIFRIAKLIFMAFLLYFLSQLIEFQSPYLNLFVRISFVSLFPFCLILIRFYSHSELDYVNELIKKGVNKLRFIK